MGGKIMFMLVLVLIGGILLYVYQSGIIGRGVVYLSGVGARTSTLSQPFSTSPSYPVATGTIITNPTATPTVNPWEIPQGFTVSQLSPYFHWARFGGISPGGLYSYGQISLYANLPQNASTVDVTGWQIKSNRGGEFIPQAIKFYDPYGLLPPTDILLKQGDALQLYSSSGSVNLRLNKCMGYLPNRNQFNPPLPQNCPYTDRSQIQAFSGACQNYIYSLGGCQPPDFTSPLIPQYDIACRDYLSSHFTYRSCVDEHLSDPDFFGNEVRVWTGSSPVDQFHDRVVLYDAEGLIVDVTSY